MARSKTCSSDVLAEITERKCGIDENGGILGAYDLYLRAYAMLGSPARRVAVVL
jgi:hypothetical protein